MFQLLGMKHPHKHTANSNLPEGSSFPVTGGLPPHLHPHSAQNNRDKLWTTINVVTFFTLCQASCPLACCCLNKSLFTPTLIKIPRRKEDLFKVHCFCVLSLRQQWRSFPPNGNSTCTRNITGSTNRAISNQNWMSPHKELSLLFCTTSSSHR